MKIIKELVDLIDDELCSAQNYGEMSVSFKAKNEQNWANKFRQMAQEELNHALTIHQYTVEQIEQIRTVYTPSEDMLEKWNKAHREYIDKTAWIKMMLSL